jgi:hypothetical protein
MPTYEITDPKGRTLEITGNTPPNKEQLDKIFAGIGGGGQQEQPNTQKIARSQGNWMNEIPKYTRPALEVGGALAGGALGAVAGPVGAVAGAGLGYAAGRQTQNAMEERAGMRPSATLPQALGSTAQGVLEGSAMEASGGIIGKGMEAGMKAAGKWAPRIYNSVAKFAKPQDVKTAIENKIPVTEKGLEKATKIFDNLNTEIASVIAKGKRTGAALKTDDVLKSLDRVRNDVKAEYANPTNLLKEIDEYARDFKVGRGETIPVEDAQKLKQGIQKRMSKYYKNPADIVSPKNVTPGVFIESEKAAGHGLRQGLVDMFPELAKLNPKDAAMISLLKALPKAVGRIERRDVAQLPELVAASAGAAAGGPPGLLAGAAMKMLRLPSVMSRLSFALDKASKIGGAPTLSKAIGYGTSKAVTPDISGQVSQGVEKLDPAMKAHAASETPGGELPASKRGIEFYTADNWDDAIREWRQALKEEPGRAKEIIGWINRALAEKKGARDIQDRQKNQQKDAEAQMRKYAGSRYAQF